MRLFDLLYGMRMGGPSQPQQFQAPGMPTPTPAYGFQPPGMSTPQPPMQGFTPPSMSTPTPPQQMPQQAFGQARGMQADPRMWDRFQSPEHSQAGWMGARAPWSFEP